MDKEVVVLLEEAAGNALDGLMEQETEDQEALHWSALEVLLLTDLVRLELMAQLVLAAAVEVVLLRLAI